MPRYRAPEGTEVSYVAAGEAATVKFGKSPIDVNDEALAEVLERLADDESNPVRRAPRADKKES